MTSDTTPFSTMKEQVGKKNVIYAPSQWVYPTTTQTGDEFYTSDEIPYGTAPDATSFSTITKQVNKKRVSRKSKKERITAKSVSLSERFGERV